MSELFPTKTDVEFFASEEAKRIQELWEPKPYDVLHIKGQLKLILKPEAFGDEPESIAYVYSCPYDRDPMGVMRGAGLEWHPRKNITWLPRQGQLWRLLEEREYTIGMLTTDKDKGLYRVEYFPGWKESYDSLERLGECEGSTPTIALARALLEAIQGRKK